MAALAMMPKLLNHISNEKYQEEDNWKIDDFALGPANELLISGHNLEIPKTFISMYKEDSGKYGNRPEFNKNFDQTQPGEQLVLFLECSSIIGLKVENALRVVSIGDMAVLKTLNWKWSPTCVCFYRGKLYAASSSSTIVSVCNLDSEEKSDIVLSEMRSDCVLDMVVVMEEIYVCTKVAGRALVFSMTGSKEIEFENHDQKDAMAKSICIHERTELVFVLWNNIQIQLYSQKTSRCLRAIGMPEELHKIRVTTENILVTLMASKSTVSVYDVDEAIKTGELIKNLFSSAEKKKQNKLMPNDEEKLECHPANNDTLTNISSPLKSASKHSKVEKLRDMQLNDIKQLEENENRPDIQKLQDEIDRSKKEKDDLTEELENTRSNLSRKEADLADVKVKLDDARTDNDDLRRMIEEKEKICGSLKKRLETGRKTTEEGDITKDIYADSTENMETGLKSLIDGINDDTVKLMKKVEDVTRELKSTNLTLKKKEEDCSQIQDELDAAISEKKELEKTATETDTLKQMIEVKDKEIQHLQMRLQKAEKDLQNTETQVTLLRDRKNELVESVSKEQNRSEELQALLANLAFLNTKNIAQLEDANNRLRKEHDKAEKTQTLLSKILENLDRDALLLKTESEIVKEILQTKGKQQDMLVFLHSDFNSRIEKLKREVELLEYKMGQQNKIIDFEKKNRSALLDMVEQSCTYNDKQEITAMGLEHKALSENANTLDKETMLQTLSLTQEEQINMIHNQTQNVTINRAEILAPSQTLRGPMTQTPKENKKELVEKGSTEENVSKLHHDSNLIPLTPKRLPEDEQMLETRKEGVTEMTSFQAGTYSPLEQIQNFRVTKENRQLSFIENKLQGVQDKVKYETFQFEYLKDFIESSDKLLGALQQSTFLKTVDALVKEISNGKDKLGKLKDYRDNTVEEYEVQRDWLELHELQVSLVVSQDGGKLKIPGSDVSLDIPSGAMQEQREIQMKIIPHCLDPGGDPISFSSNSSVVVELLPNKLQFQKTVHLRLPHCLHLNDKYNSLKDAKVLISHHDKDDAQNWDVSTDTECKLQKDHCVIPLKKFCWVTCRFEDKVVTAKRLKIFTAGRDLELSDRVSEVEVGYFPDLPGSGEILRKNPKLRRGQIKPFLFQKNEKDSTLQISLQQVIPSEWQNESSLGDKQIFSYQSICTGTEMSCPFHLQYTTEGSPMGKVPLCLFLASQENAEEINITFRPEVKCDEDRICDENEFKDEDEKDKSQHLERQ